MIDVCAVIERETGQKVTEGTPLEELNVDSLEFLDLLLTLGILIDGSDKFQTVGDLVRELA